MEGEFSDSPFCACKQEECLVESKYERNEYKCGEIFSYPHLYMWYPDSVRKGGKDMLPKDPVILLSYINTKLRDCYESLDALCEGLEVDGQEITKRLASIEYHYDRERNQFV